MTPKKIAQDIVNETRLTPPINITTVEFIVTKTLERLAYEIFSGNLSGAGKLLETFDPGRKQQEPQPVV